MITYKQAEEKIFDAYFKDEIKPLDARFCFCGSLCGNKYWRGGDKLYTAQQYRSMELELLNELCGLNTFYGDNCYKFNPSSEYEDALFEGMSKALDVLKSIHKSRREIIDEPIGFKKRQLLVKTQSSNPTGITN